MESFRTCAPVGARSRGRSCLRYMASGSSPLGSSRDPAMGFPAGAPAGYPEQMSTSSIIHAFAPLAFLALVAACLVLARRFATEGHRTAAAVTVVIAVASFLLPLPFGPLHSVRLFVAVVLGFAWITTFAVRLAAPRRRDAGTCRLGR